MSEVNGDGGTGQPADGTPEPVDAHHITESQGNVTSRVTAENQFPARQETGGTWGTRPEHDETEKAPENDGNPSPDTSLDTDVALKELRAEFAAMFEQQAADIRDLKAENRTLKEQGAKYEADIRNLKVENDASQASQKELRAEIQALKDSRQAAPDALDGKDQLDVTLSQDASRAKRKQTEQGTSAEGAEVAKSARWRDAVTSEHLSDFGTLATAAETVTQFAMHPTSDGVVGLGLLAIGLTAFFKGKIEKHRKEEHDRQNRRQAGEGAERGAH